MPCDMLAFLLRARGPFVTLVCAVFMAQACSAATTSSGHNVGLARGQARHAYLAKRQSTFGQGFQGMPDMIQFFGRGGDSFSDLANMGGNGQSGSRSGGGSSDGDSTQFSWHSTEQHSHSESTTSSDGHHTTSGGTWEKTQSASSDHPKVKTIIKTSSFGDPKQDTHAVISSQDNQDEKDVKGSKGDDCSKPSDTPSNTSLDTMSDSIPDPDTHTNNGADPEVSDQTTKPTEHYVSHHNSGHKASSTTIHSEPADVHASSHAEAKASTSDAGDDGLSGLPAKQSANNVFVIEGQPDIDAPFQPPKSISWPKGSGGSGQFRMGGYNIARPADAAVCNRKFPFSEQPYDDSVGKESRFLEAYDGELDKLAQLALDLHNEERERYGYNRLVWNAELAAFAACWSDLKAYGHSQRHFSNTGENIGEGMGGGCYDDPESAMENTILGFLDEDKLFRQSPGIRKDTGHWTQCMWKETQAVGCAVAARRGFMGSDDISYYATCSYYPAGNVLGRVQLQRNVPTNVVPPPRDRSACSSNLVHTR